MAKYLKKPVAWSAETESGEPLTAITIHNQENSPTTVDVSKNQTETPRTWSLKFTQKEGEPLSVTVTINQDKGLCIYTICYFDDEESGTTYTSGSTFILYNKNGDCLGRGTTEENGCCEIVAEAGGYYFAIIPPEGDIDSSCDIDVPSNFMPSINGIYLDDNQAILTPEDITLSGSSAVTASFVGYQHKQSGFAECDETTVIFMDKTEAEDPNIYSVDGEEAFDTSKYYIEDGNLVYSDTTNSPESHYVVIGPSDGGEECSGETKIVAPEIRGVHVRSNVGGLNVNFSGDGCTNLTGQSVTAGTVNNEGDLLTKLYYPDGLSSCESKTLSATAVYNGSSESAVTDYNLSVNPTRIVFDQTGGTSSVTVSSTVTKQTTINGINPKTKVLDDSNNFSCAFNTASTYSSTTEDYPFNVSEPTVGVIVGGGGAETVEYYQAYFKIGNNVYYDGGTHTIGSAFAGSLTIFCFTEKKDDHTIVYSAETQYVYGINDSEEVCDRPSFVYNYKSDSTQESDNSYITLHVKQSGADTSLITTNLKLLVTFHETTRRNGQSFLPAQTSSTYKFPGEMCLFFGNSASTPFSMSSSFFYPNKEYSAGTVYEISWLGFPIPRLSMPDSVFADYFSTNSFALKVKSGEDWENFFDAIKITRTEGSVKETEMTLQDDPQEGESYIGRNDGKFVELKRTRNRYSMKPNSVIHKPSDEVGYEGLTIQIHFSIKDGNLN